MTRSYYSDSFKKFLDEDGDSIYGKLLQNDPYSTSSNQKIAWKAQIEILQNNLSNIQIDRILFEYTIPRMGRRVDNIIFYKGVVYLLEFKIVDEDSYKNGDLKQVEGYALDLKYFQAGSRNCKLVPILVVPTAPDFKNTFEIKDDICKPLKSNGKNLEQIILLVSKEFDEPELDSVSWEQSEYSPTPTIIEACQALYADHKVEEITRNDREGQAFIDASKIIEKIIADSKNESKKSLVFLTGVPGSGKTLVGLDVASKFQNVEKKEHAVYVCGTSSLIHVIQEALVRDKYCRLKGTDKEDTKENIRKDVMPLFQVILHYRKAIIEETSNAYERIVVFDEAQRMWDQHEADKNIKAMLLPPKNKSEPDLLIGHTDKHHDWAVILCLLGGGQEINKGEDGLVEWLKSIQNNFPHWHVYAAPEIKTKEYLGNDSKIILDIPHKQFLEELHLKTSTRSFKAENFSKLINHLLEREISQAKEIVKEFNEKDENKKYHLVLTRDFEIAKKWVKSRTRGTDR